MILYDFFAKWYPMNPQSPLWETHKIMTVPFQAAFPNR